MSTYEPGTVAVATVRGVPNVRVMRRECFKLASDAWHRDWAHTATQGFTCSNDEDVTDVRPLVVLDITDPRRVIADLTAAIEATGNGTVSRNLRVLRDQIEAQTKPPKPGEPSGLGAVVEDARGVEWTRVERGAETITRNPWYPADCEDQPAEWCEIDAVRVLSEGVTQP